VSSSLSPMSRQSKVFVLLLAGAQQEALAFVQRRYPGRETVILPKTELRESGWKNQLRKLRELSGEALVIFTDSLESLQEPMLFKWTVLVHQCRETVLADSSGASEVSRKVELLGLLPRCLMAALADVIVLASAWIGLQLFQIWLKFRRAPEARASLLDLAFLYPSQAGLDVPGGALTHVTGFLSGLAREGASCVVLSGRPLQASFHVHHILGSGHFHLFREVATLSYNFRFIFAARKLLAKERARLLYQRHGRFMFAGALLSRLTGIPLVLEYNGSEDWIAKYWDPTRFSPWLRLCERASIKAASLIAVVSNPLKERLIGAGVPAERILVNPNAVDPEQFHPHCGGAELRENLGFRSGDIVVCFVGTFSYWHGVAVLEQSVRLLLGRTQPACHPLRFLLVGDGPLAPQMRNTLEPFSRGGSVVFTGAIPHESVRAHLDAADILVSPHVPLPGGSPFFGSPTKLFEYMATGKAIVASALDQIAEVLEHGRTALLVKPGDPGDVAEAIKLLAADEQLRIELGRNARETTLERHTWRQNARRVLAYSSGTRSVPSELSLPTAVAVGPSSRSRNLTEQNLR
jgi:glycosyltransferase involved in cell wall biosynthesis